MKRAALTIFLMLIAGCAYQRTEVKSPTFDEQLEAPRKVYATGSIWQGSSGGIAEDVKARKKGDLLTIAIVEQASASKEAATGTNRSAGVSAGIPNLLGLEKKALPGVAPGVFQDWLNQMDLTKLVSASTDSKYNGSGSTSRKENLSATITAKVLDVLPNGNLLIEGKRNVRVNNEDQVIVLEGMVRPRDINQDNIVSSSMVADARISYTGNGVISDRQSPGWLMNLLDKIWPF